MPLPLKELAPPIEPGEALGDALLPYSETLPPLLNPALGSEPLPEGTEVAPEDVEAAPPASVPAAGTLTEPEALAPAPLFVPPILPDGANAACTQAARANVNDQLSLNAMTDIFILHPC